MDRYPRLPDCPNAQISLMGDDGNAPLTPGLSAEADDVDAACTTMQESRAETVHPLQDEEWCVRRFLVRDPDGRLLNMLGHRTTELDRVDGE